MARTEKQTTVRPPEVKFGILKWVRMNLFSSTSDTLVTLSVVLFLAWVVPATLSWLFFDSVGFSGDEAMCREATGACWPFMREKARLILFGTYPYEQQWRAAVACLVVISLVATLMLVRLKPGKMLILWLSGTALFITLMLGGVFGLPEINPIKWNGLPVFLLLSVLSLAAAFPLGIILALARHQREHALLRNLASTYIEFIRGVPLLTVLFMGLFILPLVLPKGFVIEPLFAVLIALMLFHAAYFAEDIRGGLQSMSPGQFEAADSLGMKYHHKAVFVILPQALRTSLPAIFNTLIGGYKDTSLVVIVGIHDMLSTAKMAYSDPGWQRYGLEAYFFVGLWYFLSCSCLSAYGRRLEKNAAK